MLGIVNLHNSSRKKARKVNLSRKTSTRQSLGVGSTSKIEIETQHFVYIEKFTIPLTLYCSYESYSAIQLDTISNDRQFSRALDMNIDRSESETAFHSTCDPQRQQNKCLSHYLSPCPIIEYEIYFLLFLPLGSTFRQSRKTHSMNEWVRIA